MHGLTLHLTKMSHPSAEMSHKSMSILRLILYHDDTRVKRYFGSNII